MNVGHPSNLARIVALYNGIMDEHGKIIKNPDLNKMREHLYGISISDDEVRKTIAEVYSRYAIMLEPHGAVAWQSLVEYLKSHNVKDELLYVSLETAHPAKFPDEIEEITGRKPDIPESLSDLDNKKESYLIIDNSYEKLTEVLLNNF